MKFLVAPSDWGLGHATRCVPIIHALLARGQQVTLATSGNAYNFLKSEFPALPLIELPSYSLKYPKDGSMALALALQSPKLLGVMAAERRSLNRLVAKHGFDAVISDSRLGFHTRRAWCIYISHQLQVKASARLKALEPALAALHRCIINRFDEMWIPDLEGEPNLAGELSHPAAVPSNAKYIGILSRFASPLLQVGQDSAPANLLPPLRSSVDPSLPPLRSRGGVRGGQNSAPADPNLPPSHISKGVESENLGVFASLREEELPAHLDLLVLLSGPEPQRSIFERLILDQLAGLDIDCLVVRGKPGASAPEAGDSPVAQASRLRILPHLSTLELARAIQASGLVLARSGYSTLMDLAVLGGEAILVPTPGQTEQKYLADLMMNRGVCYSERQERFDLRRAMGAAQEYSGFHAGDYGRSNLDDTIRSLLNRLSNRKSILPKT